MDIKEKAKEYAESKALNAITTAIEDAYAAGYKEGYADGYASKEKIYINDLEAGVEFKDLGLPSGTKWAIDYLRSEGGKIFTFTYEQAQKYNLPTRQQFVELYGYTERIDYIRNDEKYLKILGTNGQTLFYPKRLIDSCRSVAFWLKDENNFGAERLCVKNFTIDKMFMGRSLPVILVR